MEGTEVREGGCISDGGEPWMMRQGARWVPGRALRVEDEIAKPRGRC